MVAAGPLGVRRATESDLDVLADFSLQLNREQHRNADLGADQLKDMLRKRMGSDSLVIVFEVGGEAVGYTLVSRKSDPLEVFEYFLKPRKDVRGTATPSSG